MSTVLPIEDKPRWAIYTAADGQVTFAIPFVFQAAIDVSVFIEVDDSWEKITGGYTISGAENPNGGSVTFSSGRAAGDRILVLGNALLERVLSIVRSGRFSSKAIDDDFDRLLLIVQELDRDRQRAIKSEYGEDGLTVAAGIADGKALIRQGGRLIEGPDANEIANAQGYAERAEEAAEETETVIETVTEIVKDITVKDFATIANAELFSPDIAPDFIRVAGHTTVDDGSGDTYAFSASEPAHSGKFSILLSDGITRAWYELFNSTVNPIKFGASGDGASDDTIYIQRAIAFLQSLGGGELVISENKSFSTDAFTLPPNIRISGFGTLISRAGNYAVIIPTNANNSSINDITIDCVNVDHMQSPNQDRAGGIIEIGTSINLNCHNVNFINIPTGYGQRYHATLRNAGTGTWSKNRADGCGGDIYNFNGGFYTVIDNYAANGGDGGIAFNNGATGNISFNRIHKCDLGIGSGPQGSVGSDRTPMNVIGNIIDACGDGMNFGWFSYTGRLGPSVLTVSNNGIYNCKRSSFSFFGNPVDGEKALVFTHNISEACGNGTYDGSSDTTGAAFVFRDIKEITFNGNTVVKSLKKGVVFGNVTGVMASNTITTNQGVGVDIVSSTSFAVGANWIRNNTGAAWAGLSNLSVLEGIVEGFVFAEGSNRGLKHRVFSGTVDGAGEVIFGHGVANAINHIVSTSCFYVSASSTQIDMAHSYTDGTNIKFTGGVSGRPFRAVILFTDTAL